MDAPQYIHLPPGSAPPDLPHAPFRAVVVAEQPVGAEWRNRISEWLVRSGCLYLVAWGHECEAWHDDVDIANLEDFDYGDIPNEKLVMTTWHDKEPLTEALWFAAHCASHSDVDLERTYIVHVASHRREEELRSAYRDAALS